jgi:DNA-directed RNA polymerase II subunit RPB1
MVYEDGSFKKREAWVLDTTGTNLLGLLNLDYIDKTRTSTNDIMELYDVLGVEAARQLIYNEIVDVMESTYINYHHVSLLCDRMTNKDEMISIRRNGINQDDIGPIAKACFEQTPQMFIEAAQFAELDPMRGVSANVMCGQEGYFGTNSFQVLCDPTIMQINPNLPEKQPAARRRTTPAGPCDTTNIRLNNPADLVESTEAETEPQNMAFMDDDYVM